VNPDELFRSIVAARPGRDDILYLERRGSAYAWRMVVDGSGQEQSGTSFPDAWMYFSAKWPLDDADLLQAFFDDLLAELESMGGGVDRCRWPLDEPWPHMH